MSRLGRTIHRPKDVPGLEQVGHDFHSATLPLTEHSHNGAEICYLARGEVTWLLGRRRMRLVGGMISVMQPGVLHRGEMDIIAPSDLYWAVLRPRELVPRLDPVELRRLTKAAPYTAPAPEDIGTLFEALLAECGAGDSRSLSASSALAALVAVRSARALGQKPSAEPRPSVVEEAAQRLAESVEDPPRMRDLARGLGLGPTAFHAMFRRSLGMTPADYLRRARLERAKEALAGTDEDITMLAMRLGFASSQYFATAFRRHTGLQPSEYRRRMR